jgi:hypothetical protein
VNDALLSPHKALLDGGLICSGFAMVRSGHWQQSPDPVLVCFTANCGPAPDREN